MTQTFRIKVSNKNLAKLKGLNDSYRSNNMGEVGFGFNGVAIFNPYDRYCCDAGLYELRNAFSFAGYFHQSEQR